MNSKTITVEIYRRGAMCFIPVTFDPKAAFGKVRAPVRVTLNGFTYRSTIAAMGGITCIPLSRSNREAAGLSGGETMAVTIVLDTGIRDVEVPEDLKKALRKNDARWKKWQSLSCSNRREAVESINSAKRPETRARRIVGAVRALTGR
jgi:hypothetical protein